ncbi:MAG: T9SS type A sorting domain-containing protein [Candidatus Kapaibacterium sp.]
MKYLILLILFINTIPILSDAEEEHRRAKQAFMRYMKSAHPIPTDVKRKKDENVLFSTKSLPNFLNVDATMDETESEPNKMQNESSIAINPKNPANLIASAVDYRANSSTWVYVSSDGGNTWRNLNLGKPYPHWRSTNDPSVYFDNEGVGYLCYGGFGDVLNSEAGLVGENGVFIARTTDEGITWEAHIPVILHTGNQTMDSTFEDKYYIQVDNSYDSPYHRHAYIPWKRVTPRDSATQIVISKSIDLGKSWSEPVNISYRLTGSSEDTTYGQSFPLASTGPTGELYVVWNHGIEHAVAFSKSYDGGTSFTEPRLIQKYNIFGETKYLEGQGGYRHSVKGTVRAETYPVIITDITNGPRRGHIYLTWAGDNYPNIYFSKSTDEGETWSDPIIVHKDTTNDQFWQWMSIDPLNGDLSIMYLDSRNDPENIMVECYVSYSSDGGETWIEKRVSDINSDIRLNPFSGRSFAGDYSGSAFYDGIVYPSWVDMRNAVTNIADSDIFTAVINTRAPEAPENFRDVSDHLNPMVVSLNWQPPSKRAFGQELKSKDFVHRLLRNDTIIATLEGDTDAYEDSDINLFEKHEYKIYAVAGKDSSMYRELVIYPGGSAQPSAPEILSASGNTQNDIELNVKLPTLRSDSLTPLINLNELGIFRDNILVKKDELTPADTGKTLTFHDNTGDIGFYYYKVNAGDYFDKANLQTFSDYSNEINVFTGSHVNEVIENFDEPILPNYYFSGNWEITDEISVSGKYSLSNAPNRNYGQWETDTLVFLPVYYEKDEELFVTFMHICEVFPDDTAMVEVSYDDMKTWEKIAEFNQTMYEPWKDKQIDEQDWRFERIAVPTKSTEGRLFVRLRFASNLLRYGKGWYLDDIVIGDKALHTSDENIDNSIKVFPNPAGNYAKILSGNFDFSHVKMFNLHGKMILEYISDNTREAELFLQDFPSGVYFVEIIGSTGLSFRKMLIINK